MVSSFKQSFSLYELSLSTDPPPQLLSVAPATLLALLRATIDLLIEHKIRAQLLIKLPLGKIWYSEIERYNTTNLSEGIYSCSVSTWENNSINPLISLKLAPTSKLQREYFLLLLANLFAAHKNYLSLLKQKIEYANRQVLY